MGKELREPRVERLEGRPPGQDAQEESRLRASASGEEPASSRPAGMAAPRSRDYNDFRANGQPLPAACRPARGAPPMAPAPIPAVGNPRSPGAHRPAARRSPIP